jgi:hypothetical protein
VGGKRNGHGRVGWMGVLAVPWSFPLGCWLAHNGILYTVGLPVAIVFELSSALFCVCLVVLV